jgi:hypothetical protein
LALLAVAVIDTRISTAIALLVVIALRAALIAEHASAGVHCIFCAALGTLLVGIALFAAMIAEAITMVLLAAVEAVLVDGGFDIAVLAAAIVVGLLAAMIAVSIVIVDLTAIIAVLAGIAGGTTLIAVPVSVTRSGIGHAALGTVLVAFNNIAALVAFAVAIVFLAALVTMLIRKTLLSVFSAIANLTRIGNSSRFFCFIARQGRSYKHRDQEQHQYSFSNTTNSPSYFIKKYALLLFNFLLSFIKNDN